MEALKHDVTATEIMNIMNVLDTKSYSCEQKWYIETSKARSVNKNILFCGLKRKMLRRPTLTDFIAVDLFSVEHLFKLFYEP